MSQKAENRGTEEGIKKDETNSADKNWNRGEEEEKSIFILMKRIFKG